MDGYSIAIFLIALFVSIYCPFEMGSSKRYDFNYELGQAMEKGLSTLPNRKVYRKVLLRCLFFPVFGWPYLAGWWWAEDYGLKEGKASIGEMDKPNRAEVADSG